MYNVTRANLNRPNHYITIIIPLPLYYVYFFTDSPLSTDISFGSDGVEATQVYQEATQAHQETTQAYQEAVVFKDIDTILKRKAKRNIAICKKILTICA